MGFCKWMTTVTSVAVLGLAFYLYSPVPSGLEEPWLARTYMAAFKLANMISYSAEKLTGIPRMNVLRRHIEALYIPVFRKDPDLQVEIRKFDGIPVLIYRPVSAPSRAPCVVYFHGGGWSLFSVDSYDLVTTKLSQQANVVVVAVDFRLAPERPYPIPFDDCVRVTRHVLHHAEQYKIDYHRVAVAGDGTGGNLAAAVALRLSEEDPGYTPPLKLQVLIQPVLQAFTFDTPSYRQNADNALVGRSQMIQFWCQYLGIQPTQAVVAAFEQDHHISFNVRRSIFATYVQESKLPVDIKTNYVESPPKKFRHHYDKEVAQKVEAKVIDPFVSPLLAEDLSKVAPAYILVAEYDVARDDGLFYASRLEEANIGVAVKYIKNQTQGFLTPMLDSQLLTFSNADKIWQHIYSFLKREL